MVTVLKLVDIAQCILEKLLESKPLKFLNALSLSLRYNNNLVVVPMVLKGNKDLCF